MAEESQKLDSSGDKVQSQEPAPEEWKRQAEAGDDEYQVKLGQHFLTLADSDVDRDLNGQQAVLWLSKASKQGNDQGTEALQKCLETGTGITDDNREDVKWCVSTTNLEKKIRFAARNLFTKMNSTQKAVLSPDEYAAAVKGMTGGAQQKLLLAAGKRLGDNISEHEFVKVLSKKVQGQLTLTSTEQSDAYSAASPIQKVVKYPRETVMVLADQALEFASKDGLGMVMSCVPTDQIYFLTLFLLYGFMSPKFLLLVVPLIVFYIAYATMVVTTLQMFYKKKKLKEASTLAEMLKEYDVGVDVEQTQSQYSWNSLTPYLVFFSAVPMTVISFSLADKAYIPCSELCTLCLVLCSLCFMAISDSHDLVTLLALFCNFLAALPTFLHNFPETPVITPLLHLVSGSFYSIDLHAGLKLNIGIPSLCYIIIPIFFIQMAARGSFQGMYKVLVPHLVCFFWFNLIPTMYTFSTWFGLARATVGVVLLPFLIPLSLFIVIILMIYVFVRLSVSDMFGKIVITLLLGCIPILLTQTKKLFGGKLDKKYGKLKKVVMIAFAVLAIVPLIFVRLPSTTTQVVADLSFADYMNLCHPGDASPAATQIKCNRLTGTKVVWPGVFKSVKVSKAENNVASMLDALPTFISKPLRCVYGSEYDCADETLSDPDRSLCELMTSLGHECYLSSHDTYTFQVAAMATDGDSALPLTLDAGNNFKETLLALEPDDEVQIKGSLVGGLGTSGPTLKLKEITCTSRELMVMTMIPENDEDFYYNLFDQSIKVAFNFFWFPLMEYESGHWQ